MKIGLQANKPTTTDADDDDDDDDIPFGNWAYK